MANVCDKIWYKIDRKKLYVLLERYQARGLVERIKTNNLEEVRLTNKGRAYFLDQEFKNLKLKPKKKWDGRWRVVLFDVPEESKRTRDALRHTLKRLGFKEFQKSVFVFPFDCENEINFVINYFDIPEHVYYMRSDISPDNKLRDHFKLN
jgi:DNA-binding transcriptional regulator PaaX